MSLLTQKVEHVFGAGGWLVKRGGHHLEEQLDYALAVAKWLEGGAEKPVALLEADTGTGKSLGYLFPMILHWTETKQRFVIATHTISLQQQLLQGDIKVVEEYLIENNLPIPNIVQRLGMRHFVDTERVADLCALYPDNRELAALFEWAVTSAISGTGLIDEWKELYGPLPEGVLDTDICINSLSSGDVNAAYSRSKNESRNGDGILTSIMMVALEAKTGQNIFAFSDEAPCNLMFDEADQVPAVAEELSNRRMQVRELVLKINAIDGQGSSALNKALYSAAKKLRVIEDNLRDIGSRRVKREHILGDNELQQAVLNEALSSLRQVTSELKTKVERSTLYRIDKNAAGIELVNYLSWVGNFMPASNKSSSNVHAVSWSPVLNIPSLAYQAVNPAMYISNLWRNMKIKVAFTSATIGTANKEKSDPFIPFKAQLGVSTKLVCVSEQFSPKHFGDLNFVLADPSAPRPVLAYDDEQGAELDKRWLSYAASMVNEARKSGPTLVLVASYHEGAMLAKACGKESVINHKYGTSLNDAISEFIHSDKHVLITPSAWQGTSIRTEKGQQFVKNLVVTRIPFLPPNLSAERLAAHLAKVKGNMPPKIAINIQRIKLRSRTLIKLRQGFGRLIRQKTDAGTIWLCDPRFPRNGERTNNNFFIGAIAYRFQDAWRKADIHLLNGEMKNGGDQSPVVKEMLNL